MKILVFGAGIIGCVYAAKLYAAKQDVYLLARDNRLMILQQHGIILKDGITGKQDVRHVPLVSSLGADDFYDLIIVCVKLNQLNAVIPVLKENKLCKRIMFLMNIPEGIEAISNELISKHVLSAFPGIGGMYNDNYIEYILIKEQATTIGELNGIKSVPIKNIKKIFESAGFKTAICNNMTAWLKTHAVFVSCISAAIAKENNSSIHLAKNKNSVKLMVRSIKEGFSALKKIGLPILPFNLNILFMKMPQWLAVAYWQKALKTKTGTLAIAPHAAAAKDEMQLLATSVLNMVHSADVAAPDLTALLTSYIDRK